MKGQKIRTHGSHRCELLGKFALTATLASLTACGGGGGGDTGLDLSNLQDLPPSIGAASAGDINAATDVVEVAAGNVIDANILSNDSVPEGARLELLGQPVIGSAVLLDTGEIQYEANSDFEGTDSVDYVLVAADGTESVGTLYVAVACADCLNQAVAAAQELATTDSNGLQYCTDANSDPDSDGFGWENNQSCAVREVGPSLPTLAANPDIVSIEAGSTKAVAPMRNDVIPHINSVEFAIDVEPTAGVIKASNGGLLVYSAPDNYKGSDSIVYSLTDETGNTSVASVDFNIECPLCKDFEGLRLSWPANPDSENIDGYRVFFGPDENINTSTMLSEVQADEFSNTTPQTVYSLAGDLNVSGNEGGCFRITAIRSGEESEPSEPVCFSLG